MAYPSPPPKNLVLKRSTENDGNSIEAKWGNPADALWDSDHKWVGVDATWWFNASRNMTRNVVQNRGSGHATGDVVWVRDKGVHESETMYYDRSKYHPLNNGRYLNSVTADIYAYNADAGALVSGLGNERGLAHAKSTYTFQPPKAPTIEQAMDANTGIITFTVKSDEGKDQYERYDTMVCITRQDSSNRNNSYKSEKTVVGWASTRDASKDYTYDPSDEHEVTIGQWVKVTCKAYTRGLKGNSGTVTSTYYYAQPALATIRSIVASSIDPAGVVTVRLATNATATAPVDTVKLQRLYNTTYGTPQSAGLASGWSDVSGAVDNGACTGFSDTVADAIPDAKKHTWYRLVTVHGGNTRYSAAVEATCLYRVKDAVADDEVKFVQLKAGEDGKSIVAQLGWMQDDSNACEIAWSEFEDSWESNQQPTSFVIPWDDEVTATGYFGSTTVTIRGLEEGKPYYVRARRILQVSGSTTSVGDWCPPEKAGYPLTPSAAPTDVVLSAPPIVERGKGIECTWTYNGTEQTAWQLCHIDADGTRKELAFGAGPGGSCTIPAVSVESTAYGTYELTEDEHVVEGKTYYERSTAYELTSDVAIVEGKTYYTRSGDGTELDPYVYTEVENPDVQYIAGYFEAVDVYTEVAEPSDADIAGYYEYEAQEVPVDQLNLVVSITTGGEWTESEPVAVTIADAPVVGASVSQTLTEQPLSIAITSSVPTAEVTIYVTAEGVFSSAPDGYAEQAEGDVVWADVVSPEWAFSNDVYTATVTAPVLKLFDGAGYRITASGRDTATGLTSDVAEDGFSVDWAHQAVMPSRDTVIETGSNLAVEITPVAPVGAAETDVCDVYRHTCDGDYLVATDVPFGSTIADMYAPFSADGRGLAYRLCTRTADGDVDWTDIPYEIGHGKLRFDWDGRSLEFPYNVAFSSSWDKGFELREHLDGTKAGYWKPGATHKASLSTDVIKLSDPEQRREVADLASYAGGVFVRTPDGAAFMADVSVESYGVSYDSKAVPVSFNATEVALGEEFKIAADQLDFRDDD